MASRWQGEKVSISHTEILVFFSGYLDHWDSVLLLLGDESSCWHQMTKSVSPSLTLISVLWSSLLNGSLLDNCWYCIYPWDRTVIYCLSLGKVVCSKLSAVGSLHTPVTSSWWAQRSTISSFWHLSANMAHAIVSSYFSVWLVLISFLVLSFVHQVS